jgi:parallel beta-helix repeat protein
LRKVLGKRTLRSWLGAAILAASLATFLALSPAQAFAAHVRCGDVITEDTKLDSDLLNCPGDGVVIGADHLTLDLNAHTVDGDRTGTDDDGVDNTRGFDDVVIKNGVIREFASTAVFLFDVRRAEVSRLKVLSTSFGIFGILTERSRIEGNFAARNGRGISLQNCRHNLVEGNTLVGNAGAIVMPADCHKNRISENLVRNYDEGIALYSSNGNRVENNVVVDDESSSFRFIVWGVGLLSSNDNRVVGNSISSTNGRRSGIDVAAGDRNRIERNQIDGHDAGILLRDRADRNRLRDNSALENVADGIHVAEDLDGNLVSGNLAIRNGDDGIDVESAGTTLRGNTANDNGDLGIEAVPGVTDGGGNGAGGNGNPAQCTNVRCR